jgi:hypothetical protein
LTEARRRRELIEAPTGLKKEQRAYLSRGSSSALKRDVRSSDSGGPFIAIMQTADLGIAIILAPTLRDIETKHFQFSINAWRTPGRVLFGPREK